MGVIIRYTHTDMQQLIWGIDVECCEAGSRLTIKNKKNGTRRSQPRASDGRDFSTADYVTFGNGKWLNWLVVNKTEVLGLGLDLDPTGSLSIDKEEENYLESIYSLERVK